MSEGIKDPVPGEPARTEEVTGGPDEIPVTPEEAQVVHPEDIPDQARGDSGSTDSGTEDNPASSKSEEDSVSDEADELTRTRQERDGYLDTLRRLQADFENYKKRVARQAQEGTARAAEGLVIKLLPVLEATDLAASHTDSAEVQQIHSLLIDALSKEGLERISPDGGPFDPTLHDAVMHEAGDGPEQEVAEVMRAGYAWNGRVLRPAMVKVRG